MYEFIVMTAAAAMPQSCRFGRYRKVAVVKIDREKLPTGIDKPRMISDRARGVVEVVSLWDRCHVGKTARGCYQTCLAEAQARAERLNRIEMGV